MPKETECQQSTHLYFYAPLVTQYQSSGKEWASGYLIRLQMCEQEDDLWSQSHCTRHTGPL